jgi:hypothetical protein
LGDCPMFIYFVILFLIFPLQMLRRFII